MRRIFGRSFRRGLNFGHKRNDVGFVPPAVVPCARIRNLAVTCLPQLRLVAPANQREDGARDDRDVGASYDLEQTKRVRYFLVAPLIAADDRDSEDLNVRRLNEQRYCLKIASARTGTVLVDDDPAL